MHELRVGAVFPQTEIGNDPAVIRAWAQTVEELGFQHVVAFDHVLGAGVGTRPGWRGYTTGTPFHEPLILFAYIAAVTQVLELVTGVLVLPQRQTALVAKQAAEVDVLSGGRLRLGVGVGWNAVEYQAMGESFGDRGARIEEQVTLMRELWARPTVTHAGRWHQVDNAGINPRPAAGRIPVWFGGYAEATLSRVGRLGDGWLPTGEPDATARAMIESARGHAKAAGRAPLDIGLEPRLTLAKIPDEERSAFVDGWRSLGATHLDIDTMGLGLRTPDDHLAVLEAALRAVRS